MSTNFHEECVSHVIKIAEALDYIADGSVDKDDIEEQIEDITTEWQDALYDILEDADEDIDAYSLEGTDLLKEMTKKGIAPNESDIDNYNDLREQFQELKSIGASNLYEYFDDYLDVEYTIDSSGEYLGACIWIELGGPNVWVDTRHRVVNLAWGLERAEWGIRSKTADKIDAIFEEHFNDIR